MKLSFVSYKERFQSFSLTFDLLRHALQELGVKAYRRFMEAERSTPNAAFAMMIKPFEANPFDSDDIRTIAWMKQKHRSDLASKFPVKPHLRWAEYKGHAQFNLNASELILRVALFEGFLKDVHRNAFQEEPKFLAYLKPKRSLDLRKLFADGFERVKCDEIQRQVREVDRFSIKERARFFQRCLHLSWGDAAAVGRVEELTKLRHKHAHLSPDHPVQDRDIKDARKVFYAVPASIFDKASKLYPSHFEKY